LSGVSDILDGYLARKMGLESELGAMLDSMADFLSAAILLYIFLPYMEIGFYLKIWIMIIIGIRVCSLIIVFIKYHTFAFLHTYANKITGLLLFCFPFAYVALGINLTGMILCIMASISALEEVVINIKSKELNRDATTMFQI
jgi:hypothetical protein